MFLLSFSVPLRSRSFRCQIITSYIVSRLYLCGQIILLRRLGVNTRGDNLGVGAGGGGRGGALKGVDYRGNDGYLCSLSHKLHFFNRRHQQGIYIFQNMHPSVFFFNNFDKKEKNDFIYFF